MSVEVAPSFQVLLFQLLARRTLRGWELGVGIFARLPWVDHGTEDDVRAIRQASAAEIKGLNPTQPRRLSRIKPS
jgi:hypothetical protein